MQALKGVVIGLGVLIVISFGLLIYGFYMKITDPGFSVVKSDGDDATEPSRIFIPSGCAVVEMAPDGERMYLRLGGESGACSAILIVDMATGREVGSFKISH